MKHLKPSLTNHTLIYDEACPMCNMYTKAFIKQGYLDNEGRIPYQVVPFEQCPQLSAQRAANEIALLNRQTGEVTYGIDSLLKVLSARYRCLGKFCNLKLVHILLQYLYTFVSYNRKCIAPAPEKNSTNACQPSVSWSSRIAFIISAGVIVHLLVTWYFKSFLGNFMVTAPVVDFMLYAAQFVFQLGFFFSLKQRNWYDYSGQLAFVSLTGALALGISGTLLYVLSLFGVQVTFLAITVYGMVYMMMFYLHFRRLQVYNWSKWLCATWFIYRLLIYPLVFIY